MSTPITSAARPIRPIDDSTTTRTPTTTLKPRFTRSRRMIPGTWSAAQKPRSRYWLRMAASMSRTITPHTLPSASSTPAPARRSDHEEERLTEIQAHRRPGGLPLRQALCDEQRRHDRDQLVWKVDNGFADEGRQNSRQMRAVERGIDRVAGADAAPAAADDEIDRGREDRRNRGAHQPEGDPAAGPFRPVEIPAQTGGKPDGERDDAIGRGDRINRVGAYQCAEVAYSAAHPWAGDDPGQNGARRIEKYRQVEGDGNRVTGEVEAE